ncbi:hypothetical protein pipiens_018512 [Culex pipiens pipiens]|uniref:Tudor domain-containing protein n=1 Tax=Culex pipiens pipiens TaxID=38569 RepID=A0ABD1CBF3_CULPP
MSMELNKSNIPLPVIVRMINSVHQIVATCVRLGQPGDTNERYQNEATTPEPSYKNSMDTLSPDQIEELNEEPLNTTNVSVLDYVSHDDRQICPFYGCFKGSDWDRLGHVTKLEDVWTREMVELFSLDRISVFYVDYGNPDTLKIDQLCYWDVRFDYLPFLAVHCRVANIKPLKQHHPEANDQFRRAVLDRGVKIHVLVN